MHYPHLKHAAEIFQNGPTNEFVEVFEGEVRDYESNQVLFAGSADECVRSKFSAATKLHPTRWRIVGQLGSADYIWGPVSKELCVTRWWAFRAHGCKSLYGYGDRLKADLYAAHLNRDRKTDLYTPYGVFNAELAADLSSRRRTDGVDLADELTKLAD